MSPELKAIVEHLEGIADVAQAMIGTGQADRVDQLLSNIQSVAQIVLVLHRKEILSCG